jgi:hypothetical protein
MAPQIWDEAFASRYEEWSAHMTVDMAFYIETRPQSPTTSASHPPGLRADGARDAQSRLPQ